MVILVEVILTSKARMAKGCNSSKKTYRRSERSEASIDPVITTMQVRPERLASQEDYNLKVVRTRVHVQKDNC